MISLNPTLIPPGNWLFLDWQQRIAYLGAANHFRSQLPSLGEISTSLLRKELPKLSDILFQLPHDEIGPVAAKIFLRRRILRGKQVRADGIRFQQRPIGNFSVFV